jgi:uncharacterized protein
MAGETMERSVTIEIDGGPCLEAQLGPAESALGGLVVCHPHPLYGGDMENPVVVRAVEVARDLSVSTLRFNFRGVGHSTGAHTGGEGEKEDLRAAFGFLGSHLPFGRPLGVAGYSFGAWVAAQVVASAPHVAAVCLVAPPLEMLEFGALDGAGKDILLVAGTRDSYCPVPGLEDLASRIPGARAITIEGADHFFFGKLHPLGEAIRSWARRWVQG